jgi:hypothetical protein
MFMKNLLPAKSRKYLITGAATLAMLGFIVMAFQGPLFAASHTSNFCDSYQGSIQGVSNFKTACHQLVDPLTSNEKTLLQNSAFVEQLQAYLKGTTYDSQAGHILVQLFPTPGNINLPFLAVPDWTLYGDGTLIFEPGYGRQFDLQQAQLTPAEVNHILDVIVNQNAFFAASQSSYGQFIPDTGSTQLLVNADGQQKTVSLGVQPQSTLDIQTQHVFAIENFLENYHPANAHPYVPAGVAVLILYHSAVGADKVAPWPYADIQLQQIATEESSQSSTLFPIYGKRGQSLLLLAQYNTYIASQNGQAYDMMIIPLLPDALVSQPDGSHVVKTSAGNWRLLLGVTS